MYILMLSILLTYTKQFTAEKDPGALVVPLPSNCEQAEYGKIPTENSNSFCTMCVLRLLEDLKTRNVLLYTKSHFYM